MFESLPSLWIPAVIFLARICDVSLGTLRIIFVSRSMKAKATLLGFIEVFIWIVVVAQLIQNLDNWVNYVAYAGGFSVGTFLGITFENKLKVGTIIVRVITPASESADQLIEQLREAGFMLTTLAGQGATGAVKVIFTVVKRKHWNKLVEIIESVDTDAFYSVEDVKYTSGDSPSELIFPRARTAFDRLLRVRKSI